MRLSLAPPLLLVFAVLASAVLPSSLQAEDLAKQIFSNAPALRWEDGMVTGNGLIGTMHYGPVEKQVMVFNCHKFVLPNGAPYPLPDMVDMLDPLRDKMLAGEIGAGWQLYHDEMLKRRGLEIVRKPYYGMVSSQPFHPGYLMTIDLKPVGEVSQYRRSTNYLTGEVETHWRDDRGAWLSRSFASRTDDVLVTEIIAPEGGTLTARLSVAPALKAPSKVTPTVRTDPNFINFRARYPKQNGKRGGYEGVTRIVLDGGTSKVDGEALEITSAKRLLLLTKLDRYRDDFRQWDKLALQGELEAIEPSYTALLKPHAAVQTEIFNRVDFSLDGDPKDHLLPTETLLEREEADTTRIDATLLQKVFYTSRYLFMASSGQQYAPRLCGMFTGAWGAAWAGDYTCDANVNLAVLGGNILNLPECMEGYFQVIERSLPQWREAAQKFYGCRGIIGPVRIDGEVGIPIHCGPYHAHCTATGLGPWLLYPMFEHYLITGDRDFLRDRLYPLLKEQALFYKDFLTRTDQQGHVTFVPSNSPENAWGKVKPRTSAAINSTMDISACKHALRMLLFAEKELGLEESKTCHALLAKMPPYLLTNDGALKEWSWPGYGENYGHRHSSHMYTVWPAYEINPENPETAHLVPAVARALGKRSSGIVQAHDGLQRAAALLRIKRSEKFHQILKHFMEQKYLFNSLATSHDKNLKIYNYDAILCLQGLLAEMCVYTDSGVNEPLIELLPALPAAFTKGRIAGVKGRNRTTIDQLSWDMNAGQVRCKITSDVDQSLTLIYRHGIDSIQGVSASESQHGPHARMIDLPANQTVEIVLQTAPRSSE